MDTAIGILAIELEYDEHLERDVERDIKRVNQLEGKLQQIESLRRTIDNSLVSNKKLLFDVLKFLEFVACYNYMPFEAIAYGVLGDEWSRKNHFKKVNKLNPVHIFRVLRGSPYRKLKKGNKESKEIVRFENLIQKNCTPEVSKRFMDFYNQYLEMVKMQAIHNDPLNPNIEQQIHNTEAIELSEKAYKKLHKHASYLANKLR